MLRDLTDAYEGLCDARLANVDRKQEARGGDLRGPEGEEARGALHELAVVVR